MSTILERIQNLSENLNMSKLEITPPTEPLNDAVTFFRESAIGNILGLVSGLIIWFTIYLELAKQKNNFNLNIMRMLASTNILTCSIIILMVYTGLFMSSQFLIWFLCAAFIATISLLLYKRSVAM